MLNVNGEKFDGLSQAEVQTKRKKFGYNEVANQTDRLYLKLLSYFWGPIPWMIELAAILSIVVQHWSDFWIVLFLLLVNAFVGFGEERQASNAIAALKARLAIVARAKRDGKWQTVPARELVPGDVIHIKIGDIVPADAKLIVGQNVELDQSALTGESLPVSASKGNMLYSGSIVTRGFGDALVEKIGVDTYFGKATQLVGKTKSTSHFQRAIIKIGNYLIAIALAMVIIILILSVFRQNPLLNTLEFALVLLVAAIPVAMPTVLSVTMAIGAGQLAKKQAIVSRLTAIEELAGVDVICSDKTGTLTQNKLTLGEPFCLGDMSKNSLILYAALASNREDSDAIDIAILRGLKSQKSLTNYRILELVPFDSKTKYSKVEAQSIKTGKHFSVALGAPQVIVHLTCNSDSNVVRKINEFASRGYRSLAVAKTNTHGKWQLLGILPLYDPPRPQASETIYEAKRMGIKIKMLTGDHVAIAREIGRKLGLGGDIIDVSTTNNNVEHLDTLIEKADGFAQVLPEQKFSILNTLQKDGHIVGMTGDGVNDAPALKKSDCGIAVYGATDAARAAASISLLAPGLSVIIDAIKQSRIIFKRMNSYAIYRIAETIRVLLFMTLSIVFFNFYPVTTAMIVLLALMNDGAILSIAYDNVRYDNKPVRWNMPRILKISTVLGLLGVISAFLLFFLGENVFHLPQAAIQTLMYLKLSVAGHLTIFLARTDGPFWSVKPAKILVLAVLGTQILATLIAGLGIFMHPLGLGWIIFVWVYAILWFLFNDRIKLLAYRWIR